MNFIKMTILLSCLSKFFCCCAPSFLRGHKHHHNKNIIACPIVSTNQDKGTQLDLHTISELNINTDMNINAFNLRGSEHILDTLEPKSNACISSINLDLSTKHTNEIVDWSIYTYQNTKPFIPSFTEGYVIKVYDGDTITIVTNKLNKDSTSNEVYRWSIRINGYDTPEIKTNNPSEKQCAELAKKTLSDLILNKMVNIEIIEYDKYGRLLCNITTQTENPIYISKFMLDQRLAVPYFGKTKQPPSDWMKYHTDGTL